MYALSFNIGDRTMCLLPVFFHKNACVLKKLVKKVCQFVKKFYLCTALVTGTV